MSERPTPSSIRLWLARYKPDRVRCTLKDNDQRDVPKPTMGRGQWAQMERAIVTLGPSYIEAFQGSTCVSARGLETDDDDDDGAVMKEVTNPHVAMMQILPMITQLIVDAGDASAQRHQAAYELAFAKQLELVKILSDRLGGLERAWHKMLLDQAAARGGGDDNDGAAMSLIGNLINRDRPNGAAPKAAAPTPTEDG